MHAALGISKLNSTTGKLCRYFSEPIEVNAVSEFHIQKYENDNLMTGCTYGMAQGFFDSYTAIDSG